MKRVETSGKTREEAIQNALKQLGVEMYEVDKIEILDEGSRGFLGFGARDVRVRLTCEHLEDTQPREKREQGGRDQGGRDRDRGRGGRGRGGRGGDRPEKPRGEGAPREQEARPGSREGGQQPRGGQQQQQPRGGRPEGRGQQQGGGRGQDRQQGGQGQGGQRGQDGRGGRGGERRQQQPQTPRTGARPGDSPVAAPVAAADGGEEAVRRPGSVHDEALEALRRAEMFEQAQMENTAADTGDLAEADEVRDNAPEQPEETFEPITDEQGREAAEILAQMIEKMGLKGAVNFHRTEDGTARLEVVSEDSAMLIGRKGRTLSAMQYLINRMLVKGDTAENTERLVVDVEGYVDRRREALQDMARSFARKAKDSGRVIRLKPLSPQERRIVHMTLRDDADVRTASHGESLYRSISITPTGAPRPRPQGGDRSGRPSSGRGGRGRRPAPRRRREEEQDAGTLGD